MYKLHTCPLSLSLSLSLSIYIYLRIFYNKLNNTFKAVCVYVCIHTYIHVKNRISKTQALIGGGGREAGDKNAPSPRGREGHVTQRVLGTVMGDTSPNHNSNS